MAAEKAPPSVLTVEPHGIDAPYINKDVPASYVSSPFADTKNDYNPLAPAESLGSNALEVGTQFSNSIAPVQFLKIICFPHSRIWLIDVNASSGFN